MLCHFWRRQEDRRLLVITRYGYVTPHDVLTITIASVLMPKFMYKAVPSHNCDVT